MNYILIVFIIGIIYGLITLLLMFWNKEDVDSQNVTKNNK